MTNKQLIDANITEIRNIYGYSSRYTKYLSDVSQETTYSLEFRVPNKGEDFLLNDADVLTLSLFGVALPTTKRLVRTEKKGTTLDPKKYNFRVDATDVYGEKTVIVPEGYTPIAFGLPHPGETYLSRGLNVRTLKFAKPNKPQYYRFILLSTDEQDTANVEKAA